MPYNKDSEKKVRGTLAPSSPSKTLPILVADDDPVSRCLLVKTLRGWGHEVQTTDDGEEAWELFRSGKVRLVLTEWMLPGMDGLELCYRIRAASTGSSQPAYIVLLTAKDSVQDRVAAFNAGADDFISKPFHYEELRARVQAGERILALQSELIGAREKMEQLALTDPLTGLLNRRALVEALRRDEDRMRREGRPMGVVVGDVDYFKTINDENGHQTGDHVLRTVANCLKASVRGGDYVGRWGGEEFLIGLPGADIIQCAEVAERCRSLLSGQRISTRDNEVLKVTASFGAAATEGVDRESIMDLVRQADTAMYWSKNSGRNRVKIYVAGADPGLRRKAS